MAGPLATVRILELAGIGPAPFAGMVLADLGADVLRIDRPASFDPNPEGPSRDLLGRGKRSAVVDLKNTEGVLTMLGLVERAEALIEGFRPGVTERLGVGPGECLARNPRLVYGRMTGWGQEGPYAHAAGHDINYIALAGVLYGIGERGGAPVPPLNLIGDFGGGGMLLALGVVCALLEAGRSGQGQVVDAAMVDGSALLSTLIYAWREDGSWVDERGSNRLDGGAPFYGVYETADGRFISIGALEPQFYAELVRLTGVEEISEAERWDRSSWPGMRERFAELIRTRTRQEWCDVLERSDACFAPVLSMAEAPDHPQNAARTTFVEVEGLVQPGPAPRFSRTPGAVGRPPPYAGQQTDEALADWGLDEGEIARLRAAGAIT
ncbi:MAG: CaiB/BaiF CoA-transferase family protein [Actinomycetia bacterium]|nr:CaiB/BaiF CoA-transferase family protein [Actinomycetes bacterium]